MTGHTFWVIVYCLGLVVFVNRYLGGVILVVLYSLLCRTVHR